MKWVVDGGFEDKAEPLMDMKSAREMNNKLGVQRVEKLIKLRVGLDDLDKDKNTVLHWAAENKHTK